MGGKPEQEDAVMEPLAGQSKQKRNSSTGTPILAPRLLLALRVSWLLTVLGNLLLYALAVPQWLADLNRPAAPPINPATYNLTAAELAILAERGQNAATYGAVVVGAQSLAVVFALSVAVLIFWRRSNDWLALIVGLWMILLPTNAPVPPGAALVAANPGWHLAVYGYYALFTISQMLAFTLFPTRQFRPPWLRWLALAWIAVGLLVLHPGLSWVNRPAAFGIALGSHYAIVLIGIVQQYRHTATREQRNQVKWALFGMIIGFTIVILSIAPRAITETLPDPSLHIAANLVGALAFFLSIVVLCIGFGFSILRYRLWDIDFLINRSLVYAAMTAVLVLVFAGGFFLLRAAFGGLLGGEQSTLAVVASTGLVVGLFAPTRNRLRRFIDQRVYGIELDYHRALARYAAQKKSGPGLAGDFENFGNYTRLSLIGRGGMGEVYLGQHSDTQRKVAIKLLPEKLANEELRRRFEREVQVIAGLKHPNIVELYDYGEKDGQPYMVMRYLQGQDLRDVLAARGRLPLEEARAVLADVAAALDHAHMQGIVHRDIKPSNVVLVPGEDGRRSSAVLTDFGIAKIAEAGTQLTGTGMVGTLAYVAPEQIHGASVVDARADIYSFGVMAYEVVTGLQPYRQQNPGALVMAHLMQPPPDACEVHSDLPAILCDAIRRAMAKDPQDRFGTAGEFARAL
jgi:tRNA A-37 threonylcarbamoyl transferase component Bud32